MELTLIQYISIIGALYITFLLCCSVIFRKGAQIKREQWIGVNFVLGILLITFVYYFKPSSLIRWDLLVHYDGVDSLRGHDYLYAIKYGSYKEFFIANLYFWLISRMSTNSLLPVIPVLVDYLVYIYILNDRLKEEYKEGTIELSQAAYTLFFWTATFGFKLAVSGMRCVTACAIASLAVYLYCKNNKINLKSVLLFLLAASIHAFVLIIVPILFFAKLRNKAPAVIAMIVINLAGSSFIKLLRTVIPGNNRYLQVSILQIIRYWDSYSLKAVYTRSGLGIAVLYISMIILIAVQWYLTNSAMNEIVKDDVKNKRIFEYATSLTLVSLGMCFSYLYVERALYLIAYSSVMTNTMNRKVYKIPPIVIYLILALLIVIFYENDIGTFIRNYSGKGWGA